MVDLAAVKWTEGVSQIGPDHFRVVIAAEFVYLGKRVRMRWRDIQYTAERDIINIKQETRACAAAWPCRTYMVHIAPPEIDHWALT
jgi:hypothetical protein